MPVNCKNEMVIIVDCGVLADIANQFYISGDVLKCIPLHGGLINTTFHVITTTKQYVLQRINQDVFSDIDLLMQNIERASEYLKKRAYLGLKIIKTLSGKSYSKYQDGSFWRMYAYIDNTYTIDTVRSKNDAYQYGFAIGNFLLQIEGIHENLIRDSIQNFHNTPYRYTCFFKALERDAMNRAFLIKNDIEYIANMKDFINSTTDVLSYGLVKDGIVHNDARINNILFDIKTNNAVCMIDYDTIMKGKRIFDFCDGFRFAVTFDTLEHAATTVVTIDLGLAQSYINGFFGTCGRLLTTAEFDAAITCSKLITLENGIRLLTDYLNGDTYFKTEYQGQNLIRWKRHRQLLDEIDTNQIQLEKMVREAEKKFYDIV